MSHILNAIYHLVSHTELDIQEQNQGSNRMNDMGAGLEDYIKDLRLITYPELILKKLFRKISSLIRLLS